MNGIWVNRIVSDLDEWCPACLHNAGFYVRPYMLGADGVEKRELWFQCGNCQAWRPAAEVRQEMEA
jgi:hypothetical protein